MIHGRDIVRVARKPDKSASAAQHHQRGGIGTLTHTVGNRPYFCAVAIPLSGSLHTKRQEILPDNRCQLGKNRWRLPSHAADIHYAHGERVFYEENPSLILVKKKSQTCRVLKRITHTRQNCHWTKNNRHHPRSHHHRRRRRRADHMKIRKNTRISMAHTMVKAATDVPVVGTRDDEKRQGLRKSTTPCVRRSTVASYVFIGLTFSVADLLKSLTSVPLAVCSSANSARFSRSSSNARSREVVVIACILIDR